MEQKLNSVLSAETNDEVSANVEVSTSSPNNAKPNVGCCGLKPMLFSTPMVKSILDGRKSQTRRIVKPQPITFEGLSGSGFIGKPIGENGFIKPKYNIGNMLWVRETFAPVRSWTDGKKNPQPQYSYRADNIEYDEMGWKWKPSLFMPYDACRLFLRVTNVRVERLQDISEQDAINEGVANANSFMGIGVDESKTNSYAYKELWEKINGKNSWLKNPFVWVIEFEQTAKP